jgi:DNA-binding LacI/PurR family transcriptional regulator
MPNIKDVARACGLSAATVSYVLNNSRPVRPQTRERVMEAVRAMNYHPSAIARALSRKRMDTIGIVFPRTEYSPLTSPYFAPVLDGILERATRHRQNTTLFTGANWEDSLHSVSIYRDGRCDGLIVIASRVGDPVVESLLATDFPFVVVSSQSDDERLTRVDVDNTVASRDLTEYLLGKGHQRIAVLTEYDHQQTYVKQRLQGWEEALTAASLPVAPEWVLCGVGMLATGMESPTPERRVAFRRALEGLFALPEKKRPTALYCLRDREALDVLATLKEMGLRVPEDISVVGFDDIVPAATSQPPLTTVRQPLRQIGEAAVSLLLARIAEGVPAGELRYLSTEIVERESVRAI